MLPQPVGSRRAQSHSSFGTHFLSSKTVSLGGPGGSLDRPPKVGELLRQRSRVTNLALLLLLSILGVSLWSNLRAWSRRSQGEEGSVSWGRESEGELAFGGHPVGSPAGSLPKSIADTIDITQEMSALDHLIVVAGSVGMLTGHRTLGHMSARS